MAAVEQEVQGRANLSSQPANAVGARGLFWEGLGTRQQLLTMAPAAALAAVLGDCGMTASLRSAGVMCCLVLSDPFGIAGLTV